MTDTNEAILTKLESLVDRLETLGLPVRGPEQRVAVDADGNPGNVAPGELIESAWGNATVDHVVKRFADETALQAWVAQGGSIAATGANGEVLWQRLSGVWKRFGRSYADGGALSGVVPAHTARLIVHGHVGTATTDAAGYFQVPFPAGFDAVVGAHFDGTQADWPRVVQPIQIISSGSYQFRSYRLSDGSPEASVTIGIAGFFIIAALNGG